MHFNKWMGGVAVLVGIVSMQGWAAPLKTGEVAPDFTATDSNGQVRHLSDFKGKLVVLEWFNADCPFVRKHYGSHNMQALQERYTAKGVIWLSVLSSAPGKQGYADGPAANKRAKQERSRATAMLLDPDGVLGKQYGAKTTPHLFIINTDGKLLYQGAIDDNASADIRDIPGARNYVSEALEAALAGKPVTVGETRPYGCSVKYKE